MEGMSVRVTGDMTDELRSKFLDCFRCGSAKVMVTTNRLSYSIDMPRLTIVVNFDAPIHVKNQTPIY